MDKQAIYRPVQSNITKPKRKGLSQGSVKAPHTLKAKTSHTLSNAHEDINSNQAELFHPCEENSVRPKIICHAPNIVHTNIATNEHRAHIIPVDVPPTIYISADSAAHDSGIHNSDHQINGGAADITASRQLYTESSILANSMKINPGSQNISLAPSCGQNAEKHTSKENVPDISETKQVIKRRKKPAGKVIQSRYMQASANSRKQTKSSKPKITSSMDKINTGGGHGSPMKSASLHHHHLLETPPKSNRDNGLKAKASTPVAECKTFFESDMSTIQTTQCRKAPEHEAHTDSSKPHVGHEDVTQTDLDLIFSSQLCSLYVHLRVKEAADKRHKKALQDLTKLSLTNVAIGRRSGKSER
uniref:Uncharacterized protein n=1 Tax=Ciona savignyi TaxID=51511 RepID=H2ZHR2_CIOSA